MYSYHLAGLSVLSEIVFPGAILGDPSTGAADVIIRRGAVPTSIENATATGPTWAMDDENFLLRVPDVARFLVSGGRSIRVELESAATIEDATAFIAGTAFGILLHQRKHVLLHASAVSVNGAAVLFCGPSGSGKSTLAAALIQRGNPFVTDDFCAVAIDGSGRPMVHPDGRRLKLWAQAIEKLDLAENRGASVRNRLEKFYVEPLGAASAPLPLLAVYVLRETRPRLEIHVERPNVVDAALILGRNAYRPQIIRRMGQDALYFRAAATIANAAGVFVLNRPFNFSVMSEVVRCLENHWLELGLTGPCA